MHYMAWIAFYSQVISGLMLFQSILRTRLQKSIEENKHLQDRVSELSRSYGDSSAFSATDNKELGKCCVNW